MNRTRIAIAGLALFAASCTSGGTTTTGTPAPGTPTDTPTSSSSTSGSDGKLASVKPCDLISSSEAPSLGLTASPTPGKSAGAASCEWKQTDGGLLIALETSQGADGFNYEGDTKTPIKFGAYEGFTVAAPRKADGICHAVISVSGSSSVQIVANAGESAADTVKACDRATKSGELVAAKLA